MSLKHRKVVNVADDPAAVNLLRPSDWGSPSTNYGTTPTHVFDGGALGALAFRDTGAVEGLSWLPSAAGVLVSAGANQIPVFRALGVGDIAGLPAFGDAASLDVGTTAGTVAAGDHLHTGIYQPAGAYEPAFGVLGPAKGGTGIGAYVVGDLLYASGVAALSARAAVAAGQVFASAGVGVAPVWTALPTISDGLIVGVQGAGAVSLRVAHGEPAGANPLAYWGISTSTFARTNNGTYYDNTGFFGWNGDLASATEPQFGLSLESKFSQGLGQPFLVEIHHAATFSDATSVRVLSQTIDRAAPHLAGSVFAGQIDFATSSTASAQVLNARILENGDVTVYHGAAIKVVNYANGASNTGKGEFQFVSSDAFPEWVAKLSGAQKGALSFDLAANSLQFTPGANTGRLLVNGGKLFIYQSHATARALEIQASGGDLAFFSNDGSTALFRITTAAKVGIKTATPLAMLHLPPGSATANTAPLQFTSGPLEAAARAGVVEFLTDDFFATITTGAARKAFVLDDGARLTAGKIPVAGTNGRLVDGQTPLAGTKVYYVSDASGGAVTRKLTFTAGILTAET